MKSGSTRCGDPPSGERGIRTLDTRFHVCRFSKPVPSASRPSLRESFGSYWRGLGSTTRERSEEHTSELQSRLHLVCRLLLEKKKQYRTPWAYHTTRIPAPSSCTIMSATNAINPFTMDVLRCLPVSDSYQSGVHHVHIRETDR